MQFNVEKQVEVPLVPNAQVRGNNARRMMARARYRAPSVASYPLDGLCQSGPLSMIGNT